MLQYLDASSHNLYTKSAHMYLQNMEKLKQDSPTVYKKLKSGYHVVRYSMTEKWAGFSTDLVIEQVLMCSVKLTGGLSRDGGISEHQRMVWLLAMPACAEINRAMQDLTKTRYETEEQPKDSTQACLKCAMKDTQQILDYLVTRNPFSEDLCLWNIASGTIAHASVNVEQAKNVAIKSLHL